MVVPHSGPPLGTRRRDAYDFICDELMHGRRSPALTDIARHLDLSITRAKQLVAQLEHEGFVSRAAGAQRAIHVPAIARQAAIEILRADGYSVDEDTREIGKGDFPNLQLPVLPRVRHIPDQFEPGAGNDDDGTRTATGGAPGPGAAAA